MDQDTYRTIDGPSPEILFKEKNSKFYGYAFPITNEESVKLHIESLRKMHRGAGHFCYAWQIGTEKTSTRANDDGEPANSAGMPILGQIQSFKLTNIVVVVVRFFGGVKLGVGGLVSAYKTAAQMALSESSIVEKFIETTFEIKFDYKDMARVMRIIKEKNAKIISQQFEPETYLIASIRRSAAANFCAAFSSLYEVSVKEI